MEWFNFSLAMLLTVCYAYQLWYAALAIFRKAPRFPPAAPRRYAALIAARNEAAVIGQLLDSLRAQDYPGALDLYVVADNCGDGTAAAARAHGATVFSRHNAVRVGKGWALDYLLCRVWARGVRYDGYFVFDADNLLAPDFVSRMNEAFAAGNPVVTGCRRAKNFHASWVSAGYALSFLRDCRVLHHGRMCAGTSCGVTGTGFLVADALLREAGGWVWHDLSEDTAFTCDQLLRGRSIAYCGEAVFYDEQPESFGRSWTQRLRWAKGYWLAFCRYGRRLAARAFLGRDFACFDMLMCVAPAVIATALGLTVNTAAAVLTGGVSLAAMRPLADLAIGVGGSMLGMGALTAWLCRREMPGTALQKLAAVPAFALFQLTYLPIAAASLFVCPQWRPIRHTPLRDAAALPGAALAPVGSARGVLRGRA